MIRVSRCMATALLVALAAPAGAQLAELVADLSPQQTGQLLRFVTPVDGRLVFRVGLDEGPLFGTNGSAAGTRELVLPGDLFARSGRFAYFAADGRIYRTDGTPAGTTRTDLGDLDINSPIPSAPLSGGRLLVSGRSAVFGRELVVLSGAAPRLLDLEPGRNSSNPSVLGSTSEHAFAAVRDVLWVTDGTVSGTRELLTLSGEPVSWMANGDLFFFATEDGNTQELFSIWASDGTAAGTQRLGTIRSDSRPEFVRPTESGVLVRTEDQGYRMVVAEPDQPLRRLALEDNAFAADAFPLDGGYLLLQGTSLLFDPDDGTSPILLERLCSTCEVVDFYSAPAGVIVHARTEQHVYLTDGTVQSSSLLSRGVLGFVADDAGAVFSTRRDVQFTNGSRAGTRILATAEQIGEPQRVDLARVGDLAVVSTLEDDEYVLWSVPLDSSPADRFFEVPLPGVSSSVGAVARSSSGLFIAEAERLWLKDEDGLRLLHDDRGPCFTFRGLRGVVQNGVLADCFDPRNRISLWSFRADGTATQLVEDSFLPLDFDGFLPRIGESFLGVGDSGVYRTDGTPGGTVQIHPQLEDAFPTFVATNGSIVWAGYTDGGNVTVLRSDSTQQGTSVVGSVPGFGFEPRAEVTESGVLFFLLGSEVWRVEPAPGSAPRRIASLENARTLEVWGDRAVLQNLDSDLIAVSADGRPEFLAKDEPCGDLAAVGSRLFYVACDRRSFTVVDQNLGMRSVPLPDFASLPRELVGVGNQLFFVADHAELGAELFVSDGSANGTRLVHDLWPGIGSSDPQPIGVDGTTLFISADDGSTGRELFAVETSAGGCTESATSACVNGGRFRIETTWRDFQGNSGRGVAQRLTDETSYFWFFDAENVEVVVKVLDATAINGNFWVFSGALSDVGYSITVTDSQTGRSTRYLNPRGNFGSFGDTDALSARSGLVLVPWLVQATGAPRSRAEFVAPSNCAPGPTAACVNQGRFRIEANWRTRQGTSGSGMAERLTDDTGTFWFFDPNNVELVVKVLDATPINGKFWVFYGSLSDVEYELIITDTSTGARRTYRNELGTFASAGDINAFDG